MWLQKKIALETPIRSINKDSRRHEPDLSRVMLTDVMRKNMDWLHKIHPLIHLNCSFDTVTEDTANPVVLRPLMARQARKNMADVGILFAVRRPGCANCREHGLQLSELAANDKRITLVASVKETGVDDRELLKFSQDYFSHPIYKDSKWQIYRAMGGRKLSCSALVMGFLRASKRYKAKGIPNKKFGGDLYVQGGVLLFDRKGRLRFAFQEQYGEELDMAAILAGIREIRRVSEEGETGTEVTTESSEGSE